VWTFVTEAPQTYGDLKRLVEGTPRGNWPSRVNPSLSRSQALDIFRAALNGHPDEELLADNSRSGLMLRNIMRECRSRES
jgi:hypothetical protein